MCAGVSSIFSYCVEQNPYSSCSNHNMGGSHLLQSQEEDAEQAISKASNIGNMVSLQSKASISNRVPSFPVSGVYEHDTKMLLNYILVY